MSVFLSMDIVMCSPELYFGSKFQRFVRNECMFENSQWIYKIIRNELHGMNEIIFLNEPEWLLCANKPSSEYSSFLVIFKDCNLKSIRDLRESHIDLLSNINNVVTAWLKENKLKKYHFFFHYMPSTFQLHMHVAAQSNKVDIRRQPLSTVIQNLRMDTLYYRKALIVTRFCKTLKRSETHKKIGHKKLDKKFETLM